MGPGGAAGTCGAARRAKSCSRGVGAAPGLEEPMAAAGGITGATGVRGGSGAYMAAGGGAKTCSGGTEAAGA